MKNTKRAFFLIGIIIYLSSSLVTGIQTTQPQQQLQEPSAVTIHKIKGNIYEAKGGRGANGGFFIGENGVLIIDAKSDKESSEQLINKIEKLTPHPITYVILTHSDGDHVGGLTGYPQNINIISHHNTRKHMDEAFKDPKQRLYLPGITFSADLTLYLNHHPIQLIHFGPAHTNGDVIVYFPEEKVAFLGDLVFIGRDPLIHLHKGGSSFGLVKVLKSILELDADTFVHGHGDVVNKSDINNLLKSIEDKQTKIKAFIREGKSLDDIKKAFHVEKQEETRRWPSLIEVIYLELTQKE